jgi:hypothetical protein
VDQFEILAVKGHGFSRAKRAAMEPGLSPGGRG